MQTASASPLPSPDLDGELKHLQGLIEQRRFDEVVAATAARLHEFPGHRDLLYLRAVAQRLQLKIPEALATLEALENAHPAYPRLFQERGHCFVGLRKAPEAIECIRACGSDQPGPARQLEDAADTVHNDWKALGVGGRRPACDEAGITAG